MKLTWRIVCQQLNHRLNQNVHLSLDRLALQLSYTSLRFLGSIDACSASISPFSSPVQCRLYYCGRMISSVSCDNKTFRDRLEIWDSEKMLLSPSSFYIYSMSCYNSQHCNHITPWHLHKPNLSLGEMQLLFYSAFLSPVCSDSSDDMLVKM